MEALLEQSAARALERMRERGFDEALATAMAVRQDEVNIAHNEASLFRSTDSTRLALVGIVDGRRAATEITDLRDEAIGPAVDALLAAAKAAPRDPANKLSAGQRARIEQGPAEAELPLLTGKADELLEFCRREAPKVNLGEAVVSHTLYRSRTLTSGDTDLAARVGYLSMGMFGTAAEGKRVSSFAAGGGDCHELASQNAVDYFGVREMLRDLERSIDARPVGGKFTGDVVLMPQAVQDLVEWLIGQICDVQLIAGTSLYRNRVGDAIASPLLTLRSRFDAPGVGALSPDGFVASPVEVLARGVLKTLTPSLYGSLKTGLPHVPTAASGWELAAGETARDDLAAGIQRGALVGRLSMGNPASNGDFSGVIKNSFAIEGGRVGAALSETMITGNVGKMLSDVVAVSRERLDTGAYLLPWVRVAGLHFS